MLYPYAVIIIMAIIFSKNYSWTSKPRHTHLFAMQCTTLLALSSLYYVPTSSLKFLPLSGHNTSLINDYYYYCYYYYYYYYYYY